MVRQRHDGRTGKKREEQEQNTKRRNHVHEIFMILLKETDSYHIFMSSLPCKRKHSEFPLSPVPDPVLDTLSCVVTKKTRTEESEKQTVEVKLNTLENGIPESWMPYLTGETKKSYWHVLKKRLLEEPEDQVFPPAKFIFHALTCTSWDKCKVVIIGQDPYHGPEQAMGLCFSVPKKVAVPPSLKNIYKELEQDIEGFVKVDHGDLSKWAKEGVLLLNTTLTVRLASANSHSQFGWSTFTNAIIEVLSREKQHLVVLLCTFFSEYPVHFLGKSCHLQNSFD